MSLSRRIFLENAFNVRDLGGYPVDTKTTTKWGILYRSDSLANLSKQDWEIIQSRNINTIVDLRSKGELRSAPVAYPSSISYFNYSLMKELDELPSLEEAFHLSLTDKSILNEVAESMKLDYVRTLFGNIEGFTAVLNTILDRLNDGAVLFMCSAGKDRTGIIAALLLILANVGREDIIADYIVSSTYNTHGINKMLDMIPKEILKSFSNPEVLFDGLKSKPETIIALLDELNKKDIWAIFNENGFTQEQQQQLKSIIISEV